MSITKELTFGPLVRRYVPCHTHSLPPRINPAFDHYRCNHPWTAEQYHVFYHSATRSTKLSTRPAAEASPVNIKPAADLYDLWNNDTFAHADVVQHEAASSITRYSKAINLLPFPLQRELLFAASDDYRLGALVVWLHSRRRSVWRSIWRTTRSWYGRCGILSGIPTSQDFSSDTTLSNPADGDSGMELTRPGMQRSPSVTIA